MKKQLLKIFVGLTGLILGFSLPVVAQYGAPSDYYRKTHFKEEQRFSTPIDTQKCSGNYIEFEEAIALTVFEEVKDENEFLENGPPLPEKVPEVNVFPNPCSEHAIIKITNPEGKRLHIRLFNMNGQLIKEWYCEENESEKTIKISMESYDKGNYLITVVFGENEIFSKKIIKY